MNDIQLLTVLRGISDEIRALTNAIQNSSGAAGIAKIIKGAQSGSSTGLPVSGNKLVVRIADPITLTDSS